MSLSLDTVLQVVEIVRKTVEIYKRIQDGPEQMKKVGRRMERLNTLLTNLESHLRSKSKHALAQLRKSQTEDLLAIIDDTRDDCRKVYELFEQWDKNIGPWGLQWRFTSFAQAYFTLGTSADKLEALARDIEDHRRDIDEYMALMGVQGIQDSHDGIQKLINENDAMRKQLSSIHQMLKGGQPTQALTVATPPKSKKDAGAVSKAGAGATSKAGTGETSKADAGRKPSPSPSPAPPRNDYKVIFVDPGNSGRSVIAATLVKLLKEWTTKTGAEWRLQMVNSAGFFVKKGSNMVDVVESLAFSHPSYKKPMLAGGTKARQVAVAALFDNKSYDHPFKKTVRAALEARRSRGMVKEIFQTYDYILVFTAREHDNMITLRKALVAKYGKDVAPKGKGRVLHLGRYLTSNGVPAEIVDPPKNKDGTDSRENWNSKVAQLKTAVKGFLKKEMKWSQPDSKAPVKS